MYYLQRNKPNKEHARYMEISFQNIIEINENFSKYREKANSVKEDR
jgi:hypothetical protein